MRLKEKYKKEIVPKLKEALGCKNIMEVPSLEKIVINMGVNVAKKEHIDALANDLAMLSGQKPVYTKARKSISNFKVRKGMVVGLKVVLRGDRMYDFLERFINAALPRIRDFRGLPSHSFDGRGNYSVGLNDHTIFPEINSDSVKVQQGMDIVFVTSTEDDKKAKALLEALGIPFSS